MFDFLNADSAKFTPIDPFATKDATVQVTDASWKYANGQVQSITVKFKVISCETDGNSVVDGVTTPTTADKFIGKTFQVWLYLTEKAAFAINQFAYACGFDGAYADKLGLPSEDGKVECFIGKKLVVDTEINDYQGKLSTRVARYKRSSSVVSQADVM